MATKTKTPVEKREAAEAKAFIAYKEVLEDAFKTDRFRGVVRASYSMVEQARALSNRYTSKTSEEVQRKEIAAFIEAMWAPMQIAQHVKIAEAGGLDAYLAAQAKS